MSMWKISAGHGANLFKDFKEGNFVAIGWDEVGDLSQISEDDLRVLVETAYPEKSTHQINAVAGQIRRFRFRFEKEDKVLVYDPENRAYNYGKIAGDYEYSEERETYKHIRRVEWLGIVWRDNLSATVRNQLGAILALFEVNAESAGEIESKLNQTETTIAESEELDEETAVLVDNIQTQAIELIKDRINKLSWEEMQDLAAGLLRGMGYKTRVSPPGPDLGKDIVASLDGLGLEDPRIVVEVKHRKGQMGASLVRSFIGGLRPGHRGVYISTGGFSKEAKYEAERASIPLTLVDLDSFARLIIEYYDQFDIETRMLIPLVKVYWPG